MVADAFDKLITSLEGYAAAERSGEQVKAHVIKRLCAMRRKEYTALIINSIDHVTAYRLLQEHGSVESLRDYANDSLKAMMERGVPFIGCWFRALSYVDWEHVKKALEARAETYAQGIKNETGKEIDYEKRSTKTHSSIQDH